MRLLTALLTTMALLAVPASAPAAPPGKGLTSETFTCAGVQVTIVRSQGLSAYINSQHYTVGSFSFTPTGGATQTQTFGSRTGQKGAVTCTRPVEGGVFSVTLLPVPPRGG